MVRLEKRAVAPTPTPPITFVNVQVFNGTGPAYPNWTDLNLSAQIGAKRALVYLACYLASGAPGQYFSFRENGETADALAEGAASGWAPTPGMTYLWVLTDANGIVEWCMDFASSCIIRLRAYIVAA